MTGKGLEEGKDQGRDPTAAPWASDPCALTPAPDSLAISTRDVTSSLDREGSSWLLASRHSDVAFENLCLHLSVSLRPC
jgi:hypothetical protein